MSTPADLNTFIRGYVGGELFDRSTRAQQRSVLEGGSSEPPGPGYNSAGLGVFEALRRAEERAVCAALADR